MVIGGQEVRNGKTAPMVCPHDHHHVLGKYRQVVNAATMLNMSKTPHQAKIDAACELIDFWRFNPHFMRMVYEDQPLSTAHCLRRSTFGYATRAQRFRILKLRFRGLNSTKKMDC